MSVGFLVQLVNNNPSPVVFTAKVASDGDWASSTELRPDVDLEDYRLGAYSSSRAFHEERADDRATVPFTVTAAFDGGGVVSFELDGRDAERLAHDGEVRVITGSSEYAVYQMTSHASEVGGDYAQMTIFITPHVPASRWMERLIERNPALTLADITIPGTHGSGTAGGTGEKGTRCQTMSIGEQLESGIRFFDLRVRPYPSDLGIFHGTYTQNLWLGKDVLPAVSHFLADHPGECVVLLFNRDVNGDPSYDELLRDLLVGNAARGIPPGVAPGKLYDRDDATSLKLAELKGCVVVMRRDPEATFGIRLFGLMDDDPDQAITVGGASMRVQNAYEYRQSWRAYIAGAKWPHVEALLRAARESSSGWFVNFTSASHTPPAVGGYPLDIAWHEWGVNALLCRYLVNHPPFKGRLGTIMMDGPEQPGNAMVCHLLIAMNEQL